MIAHLPCLQETLILQFTKPGSGSHIENCTAEEESGAQAKEMR
jgi:hypothetical protein